jgi:hypothetical protein
MVRHLARVGQLDVTQAVQKRVMLQHVQLQLNFFVCSCFPCQRDNYHIRFCEYKPHIQLSNISLGFSGTLWVD